MYILVSRLLCLLLSLVYIADSHIYASDPLMGSELAIHVFSSLGIELKQDIVSTYFVGDGILIEWRVTNKKEYAFLYLQNMKSKEEKSVLVRTDASGNFQIPVSLPTIEWKYYVIVASGNSFASSTPQIITLIPKNRVTNTAASLPDIRPTIVYDKYPYISIGSEKWASMQIVQWAKLVEKTGKILMLDELSLTPWNSRVSISGYSLSGVSSLDQIAALPFAWSGSIFIDRTRDRIWEGLVSLKNRRSIGTMQFRIKTWEQVSSLYYLTSPNGNVTKYTFPSYIVDGNGFLRTHQLITQNFPLTEAWVYKIETVRSDGIAYFNLPISRTSFWSIVDPLAQFQKTTLRKESVLIDKGILKKINVIRTGLRRGVLTIDPKLNDLAQKKAINMATHQYVGHITPDGMGILSFADSLGIDLIGAVWENVAGGNISDLSLQDGLEESGSHRYNMINPIWKHIGIGYVLKDGRTYLVQVFGE